MTSGPIMPAEMIIMVHRGSPRLSTPLARTGNAPPGRKMQIRITGKIRRSFVTWDDWGGWADHELPQVESALPCRSTDCPGDYQLGFRVPLVVISAYTPAGIISNETHDFGRIVPFI